MLIADWDVPFTLVTSFGTLLINQGDYPRFKLEPARCQARWGVRSQKSHVPQGDGSLLRRRFATGAEVRLVIEPWEQYEQPACGSTRQDMMDTLAGHARAMLREDARLTWVPEGQTTRMLDDARLLEVEPPDLLDGIRVQFTMTLDSPFPYVMDEAQTVQTIDTTTADIVMDGTADFWPVVQVHGAFTAFTITHNDLGVSLSYDETLPNAPNIGGGQYIEIDMFRNTAYKNGDQDNCKPGIVLPGSDFFPLFPGTNSITTDADVDFLLNNAWA